MKHITHYNLHLHPVWENTLTAIQTEQYEQQLKALPLKQNTLDVTNIHATYKKNGGLVTTVFLMNGFPHSLNMTTCIVKVTDVENRLIAESPFELNLHIDAYSAQPWSFVFPKDLVKFSETSLHECNINIFIENNS